MSQTVVPIIYWSKWFDTDHWEGFSIDHCNMSYTCQMTHDRTQALPSSVTIFHASDINRKGFVFPKQEEGAAWVYHDAEAPHYQTKDVLDRMHYTMTYRLDSDFPWGYLKAQQLMDVMETPPPLPRPKQKASIAWIVSNCKASNDRHHYVKELMRYIDVDVYGHCLNNKAWPPETPTVVELIGSYPFYLAFENSNCKDYVTEKLANAYLAGVVPIVDGPSDYAPFIPSTHAVIRIDAFSHPSELANHIKTLLANQTLYNTYLDYKRPGGLSAQFKKTLQSFDQGQCDLCRLAYERHVNMETAYYPGKKVFLDNTCVYNKHYRFKHATMRIYLLLTVAFLAVLTCLLLANKRRLKRWTPVRTTTSE